MTLQLIPTVRISFCPKILRNVAGSGDVCHALRHPNAFKTTSAMLLRKRGLIEKTVDRDIALVGETRKE